MTSLSTPPRLFQVAVAAHPSYAAEVRRMVAAHLVVGLPIAVREKA